MKIPDKKEPSHHQKACLPQIMVWFTLLLLCMLIGPAVQSDPGSRPRQPPNRLGQDMPRLVPRKVRNADMMFVAKAVCSLKQVVNLPFAGSITAIEVQAGQPVQRGDVLAHYQLAPESLLELQHKISSDRIIELELDLSALDSRHTELDRGISSNTAARHGNTRLLAKLKAEETLLLRLLKMEKRQRHADLQRLEALLGAKVNSVIASGKAALVAPMDGHLLQIHPEIRAGARVDVLEAAFQVGVMQPMLLRANVYEEEALRLQVGDVATITPESRPHQKAWAKVSRIPWSPVSLDPLKPSFYAVEFEVDNPALVLREGMRVIVHLHKPYSLTKSKPQPLPVKP